MPISRIQQKLDLENELLDAVADLRKGKNGANSRLSKLVELEVISVVEYEELVRKYGSIRVENYGTLCHLNNAKKKRVLRKVKNIFVGVVAACVLLSSFAFSLGELVVHYGKGVAMVFFFLWLWSVYYIGDNNLTSKEIGELERENERLKTNLEFYNDVNRKLESKLEDTNGHHQE